MKENIKTASFFKGNVDGIHVALLFNRNNLYSQEYPVM